MCQSYMTTCKASAAASLYERRFTTLVLVGLSNSQLEKTSSYYDKHE